MTPDPAARLTPVDPRPEQVRCLTELSTLGLIAGALLASGVLWLAVLVVI